MKTEIKKILNNLFKYMIMLVSELLIIIFVIELFLLGKNQLLGEMNLVIPFVIFAVFIFFIAFTRMRGKRNSILVVFQPVWMWGIGYLICSAEGEDKPVEFFGIIILVSVMGILSMVAQLTRYERKNTKNKAFKFMHRIVCIILFYSFIYSILYIMDPSSIDAPVDLSILSAGSLYLRMLYFSVVSFTTLGFGDYLPVSDWAIVTIISEVSIFAIIISITFLYLVDNRSEEDNEDISLGKRFVNWFKDLTENFYT